MPVVLNAVPIHTQCCDHYLRDEASWLMALAISSNKHHTHTHTHTPQVTRHAEARAWCCLLPIPPASSSLLLLDPQPTPRYMAFELFFVSARTNKRHHHHPNHPASTSPPPPQTPPPPCGMPAAVCLKEALCARRKTHSCAAGPGKVWGWEAMSDESLRLTSGVYSRPFVY